jgi:signal transduction histidine kinase
VLVRELIEQLIETYFERDEARIEVSIGDTSLDANVDHVRTALLLKNLISNALRYSDHNEKVRVSATRESGDLVIAVEDRGPGFSADQVSRFGEPFYRGDPSRTRDTGGYGLGIYLAKLVAEAHGGSLVIDQSYEEGARLVATLPE